MQKHVTSRHDAAALAVLAICGLGVFADEGAGKKDVPKSLPPDIVKAWRDAGAVVGWERIQPAGFVTFVPEKEGKPGDLLPAFRFSTWSEGVLAKLPVPEAPFGLNLGGTPVTDAGLKELAGLKQLQTLALFRTEVTDVGLKELASLKQLQHLRIGVTKVTDVGLKELVGLKQLRSLGIGVTKVTDAGLKELAALQQLQALNLQDTKVTDLGLKELAGLKQLRNLELFGTRVTAAGVKELQKALPDCKIWNAPKEDTEQKPMPPPSGRNYVESVAFSSDGKRLVTYSPYSTVKLWDVQTGRELDAVQIWNFGGRLDLKLLAEEKLWDAKARDRLFSSRAPNGLLSPDGKRVAEIVRPGGFRKPGAPPPKFVFKLVVRDVQTGQELLSLDHARVPIASFAFSPDGKHLASGAGREGYGSSSWEVGAWDARVKVWDAHTGQEFLNLKGHTDDVRRLLYSPDGKRLASGSWDKTIKVWDAHTGQELLTLKGHTAGVTGLTYSPDGKRLASTSRDKTVRVWDAQAGQELLTVEGHGGSVNGVAFSPDGHRLAAGAADGRVKIWDATPLPEAPKAK